MLLLLWLLLKTHLRAFPLTFLQDRDLAPGSLSELSAIKSPRVILTHLPFRLLPKRVQRGEAKVSGCGSRALRSLLLPVARLESDCTGAGSNREREGQRRRKEERERETLRGRAVGKRRES